MTYSFDENCLSDLYKDANGFRPGEGFFARWDACDDDGKQAIWDSLVSTLERNEQIEREAHLHAIKRFESRLFDVMSIMPSIDRKRAIAVLRESIAKCEDDTVLTDDHYAEFSFGLPYGYIKGVKPGMLG